MDAPTTRAKIRKYSYTPLGDVRPGTTVDVFGVVKFLKPPKQTRGTDVILIVSLIDPTFHEQDQKLKCVLFFKPDKIPKIEVGHVVRFHRLKIGTHQGEPQGGTSAGFSWLAFSSPDADPQSSTPNYTYTEDDKKKVQELFSWSSVEDVPISDNTCCLSDIAANAYFNLVCQVVSTCSVEDGVCFLMTVWDGTRPIYPVRGVSTDSDDHIVQADPALLHRATDYMYDVCAFDDHFTAASRVRPGLFVKFYNLHAALYRNSETREDLTALPTVELVLHRGTTYGRGMLVLADTAQEVVKLKQKLESVQSRNDPQPSTSRAHLTGTDSEAEVTAIENNNINLNQGEGSSKADKNSQNNACNNGLSSSGMHNSWMESDQCIMPGQRSWNGLSVDKSNSSHINAGQMPDIQLSCDGSEFSDEPRCMQETATVILNHPHVKRTKIKDVLDHSVPSKFRIKVRVLDYHPVPHTATHFVNIYCDRCQFTCTICDYEEELKERSSLSPDSAERVCPNCQQDVEVTYMLRLLVHDGSGWLVANLWRAEAIKFFKDIPTEEVLTDPKSFSDIQDYLSHICPPGKPAGEKPWVECCVASYTTDSGVNYQIFDTVVA